MTQLLNRTSPVKNGAVGRNGRPPSLLAITSELPWPLNTGGHLRTYHLLRSLTSRFRCRLVAGIKDCPNEATSQLSQLNIDVQAVELPKRTILRECSQVTSAILRREPYVFFRRHFHNSMRLALMSELQRERPDVVYLDHLDSLVFLKNCSNIPTVIDMHNVYSTLLHREAQHHCWPVRRYLVRDAKLLDRQEQRAAKEVDLLFAVSMDDADHFRRFQPRAMEVVPNGVDVSAYVDLPLGRPAGKPLFLYVGTMSWTPNVTATLFLAEHVLPAIRKRFPDARLRVIGKDPPAKILALNSIPGVEVVGAVDSMIPHLREASALAVPLMAGGGTRLKILEAFAAGLPVVSTSVGCEGIRASHGKHLLVAECDQFASALASLFGDPNLGSRLASAARELVWKVYDWSIIGKTAADAVHDLVQAAGRNDSQRRLVAGM